MENEQEEQEPEEVPINPLEFSEIKRILYYTLLSAEKQDELDKQLEALESKKGTKEYFMMIYK